MPPLQHLHEKAAHIGIVFRKENFRHNHAAPHPALYVAASGADIDKVMPGKQRVNQSIAWLCAPAVNNRRYNGVLNLPGRLTPKAWVTGSSMAVVYVSEIRDELDPPFEILEPKPARGRCCSIRPGSR